MTEPSSVPPGCPEAVAVGPAAERGAAGDAPASTLPPWPRAHGGSSDSDSDVEGPRPPRRPRPKRRRLHLGPGVPSIPVYSNKVNSCFRLCPTAVQLRDLPAPQQQGAEPPIDTDAEEEEEKEEEEEEEEEEEKDERKAEPVLEPEPSEGATIPVSPCSPQPRSSRTRRIIRRSRCGRWWSTWRRCCGCRQAGSCCCCGTGSWSPAPPPQALGLGVADIVECVVDAGAGGEPEPEPAPGPGELRLTVQGQDRRSLLRLNVPKAQPLCGLMERYRAARGLGARPLHFFFEGRRLAGSCTPEELGMEQDDVIEVWG
ncbi:NFATC2-interacting protein isoform X4 [Rhea pennata]|uniref:NFATC2-interacting protein isoform X4 n=1 Tax=Rhea pennata TaxID=8795 RepID=UPI002E263C56